MRRGLRFPLSVVLVLACLNTGRVVKTFDCRIPTGIVLLQRGLARWTPPWGRALEMPFSIIVWILLLCVLVGSRHARVQERLRDKGLR